MNDVNPSSSATSRPGTSATQTPVGAAVRELWADDARLVNCITEYSGQDAVVTAVAASHEEFVASQGFVFRAVDHSAHHRGVLFRWEMAPASGGAAVSAGVNFLLRGDDGRIEVDYQFLER
jgi:SnoaL-like domain